MNQTRLDQILKDTDTPVEKWAKNTKLPCMEAYVRQLIEAIEKLGSDVMDAYNNGVEDGRDQIEREVEGRRRWATKMGNALGQTTALLHRSETRYGRILERNAQLCRMLFDAGVTVPLHLTGEPPEDATEEAVYGMDPSDDKPQAVSVSAPVDAERDWYDALSPVWDALWTIAQESELRAGYKNPRYDMTHDHIFEHAWGALETLKELIGTPGMIRKDEPEDRAASAVETCKPGNNSLHCITHDSSWPVTLEFCVVATQERAAVAQGGAAEHRPDKPEVVGNQSDQPPANLSDPGKTATPETDLLRLVKAARYVARNQTTADVHRDGLMKALEPFKHIRQYDLDRLGSMYDPSKKAGQPTCVECGKRWGDPIHDPENSNDGAHLYVRKQLLADAEAPAVESSEDFESPAGGWASKRLADRVVWEYHAAEGAPIERCDSEEAPHMPHQWEKVKGVRSGRTLAKYVVRFCPGWPGPSAVSDDDAGADLSTEGHGLASPAPSASVRYAVSEPGNLGYIYEGRAFRTWAEARALADTYPSPEILVVVAIEIAAGDSASASGHLHAEFVPDCEHCQAVRGISGACCCPSDPPFRVNICPVHGWDEKLKDQRDDAVRFAKEETDRVDALRKYLEGVHGRLMQSAAMHWNVNDKLTALEFEHEAEVIAKYLDTSDDGNSADTQKGIE